MSLRLLTAADFRRVPWKNGRGTTLELVRRDDAAGKLLWRLSIADVIEPGPFSPLPGIDRIITLIDGEGFDLDFGGSRPPVSLRPFEPLAFSGDWSTSATIVHGPSRDFNVMTERGKICAEVELARCGVMPPASLTYVLAIRGGVTVCVEGATIRAESGELIECDRDQRVSLEIDGTDAALVVRLTMADDKASS